MSKRFGRNQKRKMRAEIEQLTADKKWNDNYYEKAMALETQMRQWDKDIAMHLGEYSSFRRFMETVFTAQPLHRLPSYERLPVDLGITTQDVACNSVTQTVINMYRFVSCIEDIPDEARLLVKIIEVNNKTNQVYYSVSKDEFERHGLDHHFIDYMSRRISEDMTGLINKGRGVHV